MMIRQDFEPSLPPKTFMMQILDPLTRTYVFLWDRKDEDNRVDLTWKELAKYQNKNSFRTSIRKLNNEGLISYHESDKGILIEMVGWDDYGED